MFYLDVCVKLTFHAKIIYVKIDHGSVQCLQMVAFIEIIYILMMLLLIVCYIAQYLTCSFQESSVSQAKGLLPQLLLFERTVRGATLWRRQAVGDMQHWHSRIGSGTWQTWVSSYLSYSKWRASLRILIMHPLQNCHHTKLSNAKVSRAISRCKGQVVGFSTTSLLPKF